jgi:hypothetical protein
VGACCSVVSPLLSLSIGYFCVATLVVGALDPPPGILDWGLCSARALCITATCAGVDGQFWYT